MTTPKTGTSSEGKPMHYSVGAIIKKGETYCLIDRAIPPPGYACPAGHVDQGEQPKTAVIREVKEETGLDVTQCTLLFEEEILWDWCVMNIKPHYWYVYRCEVAGSFVENTHEVKHIDWYTVDQIKKLPLQEIWKYWLQKARVLD